MRLITQEPMNLPKQAEGHCDVLVTGACGLTGRFDLANKCLILLSIGEGLHGSSTADYVKSSAKTLVVSSTIQTLQIPRRSS